MTTETTTTNETTTDEINYKSWYEEHQEKVKSFDAVVAKKEELLKETKKAKEDRETANKEAAKIAEEKAKKEGDWDKLLANAKEREDTLAKELESIKTANKQEKLNNAALRIAGELAEGDNIELLSEFIVKNDSYCDYIIINTSFCAVCERRREKR